MASKSSDLESIVLLGDSFVGKTSLLQRLCVNEFNEVTTRTTETDFKITMINVNGNKVKLQMADTPGAECFDEKIIADYSSAHGIIMVYDLTCQASFDNLKKWFEWTNQNVNGRVCKMLVGTKCDLEDKRIVEYADGKEFADGLRIPFVETSAKNSTGVKKIFMQTVSRFISDQNQAMAKTTNQSVKLCRTEPQTMPNDPLIQITLVGDSFVGKSALVERLVDHKFNPQAAFISILEKKETTIDVDQKEVQLTICNTSGIECFHLISNLSYYTTDGFILVYDVTCQASFKNLGKWLARINEFADARVCKMLVGTKCDLNKTKVIKYAEGKAFADRLGIPFFETAAKDSTNVEKAFLQLTSQIISRSISKQNESKVTTTNQLVRSSSSWWPFKRN